MFLLPLFQQLWMISEVGDRYIKHINQSASFKQWQITSLRS